MNIVEKLLAIQTELKAPKNQRNTFGNYNYRSAEDILEAISAITVKVVTTVSLGVYSLLPFSLSANLQEDKKIIRIIYGPKIKNY